MIPMRSAKTGLVRGYRYTSPPTLLAAALAVTICQNILAATQAELDAACEAARERELAPMRAVFVEECIERVEASRRSLGRGQSAADYCERFYSDFGNRKGNRAPLFLDLPECVEAFENRRGR